jgi:hypothetical protein
MKKALWIVLPLVIGLAFAYWLINSPDTFGKWILVVCFFATTLVILPAFSFIRWMFKDAELTPVERDLSRKDVRKLADKLEVLGFKPAGEALKIYSSVMTGFVCEDIAVYGVIVRIEAGIGKTTFAFVSQMLDGTIGLLTSQERNTAILPFAPGSLCQVFAGVSVEELLLKHLRGLEWLHSQGLATKAASSEWFVENERKGTRSLKEFLRSRWLWHTLVFMWRFISRTSPHLVSIERQKGAAELISRFKAQPVVTPESQARQKTIEQLGAVPIIFTHSGLGIASFITSLAAGLMVFLTFILFVIISVIGERLEGCGDIAGIIALVMVVFGLTGYFVGLVCGIISLFERRRKKIFSLIGIILNALGLALFSGFICLASMK